jgi:hypothetical protein
MINARAAIEQMRSGQIGQPAACMIESNMALSVDGVTSRTGRVNYGVGLSRREPCLMQRSASCERLPLRVREPSPGEVENFVDNSLAPDRAINVGGPLGLCA